MDGDLDEKELCDEIASGSQNKFQWGGLGEGGVYIYTHLYTTFEGCADRERKIMFDGLEVELEK